MPAILAAPLVRIAVLATTGQPRSTKLATFTEPAAARAADGVVADVVRPANVDQRLAGFLALEGRQFQPRRPRQAAAFRRLAIFAIVARLQPVALWIDPQD